MGGPDPRVRVEFEAGPLTQQGWQNMYMVFVGGQFSNMTGDEIDEYARKLPKWQPSIIV